MRALVLDGSPASEPETTRDGGGAVLVARALETLRAAASELLLDAGYSVDTWLLSDARVAPCDGDFNCWVETPGICIHADDGRGIVEAYVRSDVAVCLTPLTFGGFSSELTKAVDRIGPPIIWPSVVTVDGQRQYRARYEVLPRLVVLGVAARPGAACEQVFLDLAARCARTLYAPAWAARVVRAGEDAGALRARLRVALTAVDALPSAEAGGERED